MDEIVPYATEAGFRGYFTVLQDVLIIGDE
jgi:hypothetical protein